MPTEAKLEKSPPALDHQIDALVSGAPFELPADYLDFLRTANGAEGTIGTAYLVIWSTDQTLKLNADYRVPDFAPHLFLFGSDGAGEAYAFDNRTNPMTIVRVPFIGFDQEIVFGRTFEEFMNRLTSDSS